MNKKSEIRKRLKSLKKDFSSNLVNLNSKIIFDKIEEDDEFLNSKHVFAFWSMEDEVFTHDFILKWSKSKNFYLPVIQQDIIILKLFDGIEKMIPEPKFGIFEPVGTVFNNLELIDYIIIPGLGFDRNMNRIGYGKGYYDRILPKLFAKKVAVCFDFQLIENIPVEQFDVKMDWIVTENQIITT